MDYPDVNVATPGSANTSFLIKRSGGIQSPPSNLLKERHHDMMTEDLRRSIDRLDKVIGKSQLLNQASQSTIKKVPPPSSSKPANRYSLDPHKAKAKRQSEVIKHDD